MAGARDRSARSATRCSRISRWYGRGLAREARAAGADVLHCPTFRGPLRDAGIPTVVTVHDLAVLREPSWFPAWSRNYGRALMPRAVRNADRVICVSRATARDAVGLLDVPYRKLRVIPNADRAGLLEPAGAAAARAALPALRRHARAAQEPPALLEAFTLVRRAGRRVRLALVGADGWGDVRVGSTEGVVAFGRVDDTELRDLYAHAEALVLPVALGGLRAARRRGARDRLPRRLLEHPGAARARRRGCDLLRPLDSRVDLGGHPARAHRAAPDAAARDELG